MVISFSQSNIAVALITEFCPVATYFLMLGKINRRQWKLTELACYNPLGANFSFMTIENLTFYGLFAHRACYRSMCVQVVFLSMLFGYHITTNLTFF